MFFIKLFLVVFAGAFIIKEAVLALDDIVYAFRVRRMRTMNYEKFLAAHNIEPQEVRYDGFFRIPAYPVPDPCPGRYDVHGSGGDIRGKQMNSARKFTTIQTY